jgi:two-component system LytT family sensor kinase
MGLTMLPWLILAMVFLPSAILFDRDALRPLGWRYLSVDYVTCFLVWSPYTLLIGVVLKRQSMQWPPTRRACFVHLGCAAAMIAGHVLLMAAFASVVPSNRPFVPYPQNAVRQFLELAPMDVVLYTGIVACLTAWSALSRYHERERSIVQAQLNALKARIEPHFLFNTLNALSELVYRNPEAADRAITQLATLLRQLIDRNEHEQSLRDELEMLHGYASIQQILLGDRLEFECDVPDELMNAKVPTLLLQPILENAIRHGVAQLRRGGRIHLSVIADRDALVLDIRNDGPAAQAAIATDGLGLSNTRARLQALYGPAQDLTLTFPDGGGARVLIRLPLRRNDGPQ